ncbi:cytochrome P450 [Palleronia abyssalis]|uniref:Fatty-acid peroxygenase n=1 Tax=Palleronia abyssalis TaxID=1501240 RepID=A0A2R8BQ10_9RHOB|nr:cytochrome P450 [Palleronia abyssalis]SPJ22240.1 Fatty-acid peroxygenase [Palleronia abyssalis]
MHLPYATNGDLTLRIARDPYRTVSRIAGKLEADAFHGKLMLADTVFLTGPDCARVFYGEGMIRAGAAPSFLKMTLFGDSGIQSLDEAEHEKRKAMFMSFMDKGAPDRIAAQVAKALDDLARKSPDRLCVQDEMERILTRVACDFAGVPLSEDDVEGRTRMLSALFEHAAPIRPTFLAAVANRKRANTWAANLISGARSGAITPPRGSALEEIASYRTVDGAPLSREVAAVELVNVVRPIVAVSCYLTFCAHAVATNENGWEAVHDRPQSFVQEVRRHYPFFPLVAAKTGRELDIGGETIAPDTRVVLDLYGTNHDARLWDDPMMFRPRRFDDRKIDPFDLIPQGGGDHHAGHRCAGEWVTIAIMRAFTDWLTRIDYRRPKQDLDLAMSRLPALPESRMIWENVSLRQPA